MNIYQSAYAIDDMSIYCAIALLSRQVSICCFERSLTTTARLSREFLHGDLVQII